MAMSAFVTPIFDIPYTILQVKLSATAEEKVPSPSTTTTVVC